MAICFFLVQIWFLQAAVMYYYDFRNKFKFLKLNRFLFIGGINDQF